MAAGELPGDELLTPAAMVLVLADQDGFKENPTLAQTKPASIAKFPSNSKISCQLAVPFETPIYNPARRVKKQGRM